MSSSPYHNNPFAPQPYEDMADYRIEFAFRTKEGVIVTVTDTDGDMFPVLFFAPQQAPDRFYQLNDHSYSQSYPYNGCYGLSTGVPSPSSIYLFICYSGDGFLEYTDENCCIGTSVEDRPHEKLSPLSKEEKGELESKMKSGDVQFFSLPEDSFIYSLYSIPDDRISSLPGTIAICRKTFSHHQYQALYVPLGESGIAQSIAFYDGENRLVPADLDYLPLHRRGVLQVALNEGDKFAVDFSNAVYLWDDEKDALAKTLALPCVPPEPIPLVTPLTAESIFCGQPSALSIPAPS